MADLLKIEKLTAPRATKTPLSWPRYPNLQAIPRLGLFSKLDLVFQRMPDVLAVPDELRAGLDGLVV